MSGRRGTIQNRRAATYFRVAMTTLALFVPAISLALLGLLWLWQEGFLLYWAIAAFALSLVELLVEFWLLGAVDVTPNKANLAASSATPDHDRRQRDSEAWTAVEVLANQIDPAELTSRDSVLDLTLRTVDTVARSLHPEEKEPLWGFTVPEALALIERASRDLRPFVVDSIPLGDQLTVAQVIRIYRWRSLVGVARQAYDLWRIVGVSNPISALTTETRKRLATKLYTGARDALARRLARGYVREVGRAAIDLYGGRLRFEEQPAGTSERRK
jgi:hypothetical protein